MSSKDFRQGMVAGAKPFGDKLDLLANVSERAVADISEGIDSVSGVVNCILDDLTIQEKKSIYDLDTPHGIAEMDQAEKEYLLAVLFTIADKKGSINDNQKFYLRALKTYLEVVDVQVGIDLSTIENVESIPLQKTIMQTVMEFLYLEYENHNYMDDYENYFDLFSVNRKGVRELQDTIDHIVSLLGVEGLTCHYSPLTEPTNEDKNLDNNASYQSEDDNVIPYVFIEITQDQKNLVQHIIESFLTASELGKMRFDFSSTTGSKRFRMVDESKVRTQLMPPDSIVNGDFGDSEWEPFIGFYGTSPAPDFYKGIAFASDRMFIKLKGQFNTAYSEEQVYEVFYSDIKKVSWSTPNGHIALRTGAVIPLDGAEYTTTELYTLITDIISVFQHNFQ